MQQNQRGECYIHWSNPFNQNSLWFPHSDMSFDIYQMGTSITAKNCS